MRKILPSFRNAALLTLAALLAVACSPEAKKARAQEQADRYFAAGEYEKAEIEYRNVLQAESVNAHAIGRIGIIYYDQGRIGQTFPFLAKGHELDPANLDVRLKLGLTYLSSGRLQEAREHATYILSQEPAHPEAPLLLVETVRQPAEIAPVVQQLAELPAPASGGAPVLVARASLKLRQGELDEAKALAEQALRQEPASAAAFSALGHIHWAQKNLPEAEKALARAGELSPPRALRRLQLARFKLQSGDAEAAKQALHEIAKQTPDFLPPQLLLAEIAATGRNYDESRSHLAKVLARDPAHPEALLLSARLRLAQGETAQAVTELEAMQRLYPQAPNVQFHLGNAHAAAGDIGKAAQSFSQAIALSPDMPEAVLALAALNLRRGEARTAASSIETLLQKRPDLAAARVLLAECHRATGNFDRALAALQPLQQAAPDNLQLMLLAASIHAQKGDVSAARALFERAYAQKSDATTLEQLINLDLAAGDLASARRRAEVRLAEAPEAAESHLLLAKVYLAQREMTLAETSLQKAIELRPEVPAPYFMLARIYLQSNQQGQALERLTQVVERRPNDQGALLMTAVLHGQLGADEEARNVYRKLIELNPRSGVALNNLAYLEAEKFGNLDKGLELAERARELMPVDPNVANTLGWILYRRGQYPRALALLQEGAQRLPEQGAMHFHLGLTRYMLGDEVGARSALERASKLDLTPTETAEAQEKLAVLAIAPAMSDAETRPLLEKVLARAPNDPVALLRLSAIHRRSGDLKQAIALGDRAHRASPSNVRAVAALARLYEENGETEKALELARAARKLDADDAGVAHILGRLAYATGDFSWAASVLQEAAGKLPQDPEAQLDYALAAYSVGRVREALDAAQKSQSHRSAFLRSAEAAEFARFAGRSVGGGGVSEAEVSRALQAQPKNVPAVMALAAIKEEQRDTSAALTLYEQALKLHPQLTLAQRQLAVLASREAAPPKSALEAALKAREAFPNDGEVTKAAGILLYRQNDFARAAPLLERLARERSDDAEVFFFLGMAQRGARQPAQAKENLQRAIALNLSSDLKSQATAALAEL